MSSFTDKTQKQVNAATEATRDAVQDTLQSAQQFADQAAESAKQATHQAQSATLRAIDKAQEGIHAAEKELSPVIDDLAARAQDLATKSIHFCADSSERARRQIQQAADATTRYVVEQPGKSILLAAATGAAVATAILLGTRGSRR